MNKKEHYEQSAFFDWVNLNIKCAPNIYTRKVLGLCYAVPNGFYSASKKIAHDMKMEGLRKGIPDINLDWHNLIEYETPNEHEKIEDGISWYDRGKKILLHAYAGLRIEMKYREKISEKIQKKIDTGNYIVDLRPEQKEKRELLIDAGYKFVVCYSCGQAVRTVYEYLPFKIEDYQGLKEFLI